VRAGTTTSLLGGNGAGKTDVCSMLLGRAHNRRTSRHFPFWASTCSRPLSRAAADDFTSPLRRPFRSGDGRRDLRVFADLWRFRSPHGRIRSWPRIRSCDLLRRPYGTLSAATALRVSLAGAPHGPSLASRRADASLDPDIAAIACARTRSLSAATALHLLLASHNMRRGPSDVRRRDHAARSLVVDQGSPQEVDERYGREPMEEVSSTSHAAALSVRPRNSRRARIAA